MFCLVDSAKQMYHKTDDSKKAGGIIVSPDGESVIVVMNRHSAWKKEYKWGLPKGHPRTVESPASSAQREVFEETGLHFPLHRFKRHIYLNGNYYYIIVLKTPFREFKTNDAKEISEVRWMKISELRESNYNSDIKRFLKVFPNNKVEFSRSRRLRDQPTCRNYPVPPSRQRQVTPPYCRSQHPNRVSSGTTQIYTPPIKV